MTTNFYKQRFNKDFFEHEAWNENKILCGIDESGRGCLAGPVVAGAVILKPNKKNRLIKDSKLLTQSELLIAYEWIIKNAWYSFAIISAQEIDRYNIYQATLLAMKRAFMQIIHICPYEPFKVLIDAMPLSLYQTPHEHIDVLYFPFGESKSTSIAAASIVAKVTRDALIGNLSFSFPQYNLAKHKGYCTADHQAAIMQHGDSIIHRLRFVTDKSFSNVSKLNNDGKNQQCIC